MRRVTGTTYSSTIRACDYPGCDALFTPLTVRARYCQDHRGRNAARYAKSAGLWTPEFIAVDGEGVGRGKDHRYVLLGCGNSQREWPDGIRNICEIFEFLYGEFGEHPDASFVGFFLGYDFNMWLRLLPRERAARLLTVAGQNSRKHRQPRLAPHPVEYDGWQFDILGMKRFKLRPKVCDCRTATCKCEKPRWMYINDTGPFFQASLMSVIDPREWQEPIVTDAEYELLKVGKGKRDSADLDDDMRMYNQLENEILARLMGRLNVGFVKAGVKLTKRQWFGPGQAAQSWMHIDKKLARTTDAVERLPVGIREAAIATYYGGWFELAVHGFIPGITYEYDLNSAYPTIASRLPCLCGRWTHGKWSPKSSRLKAGHIRMVHARIRGKDKHLGPLMYRVEKLGGILRPQYTAGWYWQHEINAARKAGLIDDVTYLEWYEYEPCNHPAPLRGLTGLYEGRQRIGKDTAEGKAYKLLYNSVYGKLAQSLGEPIYANPIYASLITAGCRTMILEAIATHPDRSRAVAMVATDGVYFLSPHPSLPISDRLGDWSYGEKHNMTAFKPGVYWDDKAREAIRAGEAPRFKARGISARYFAASISRIDDEFKAWDPAGTFQPEWKDDNPVRNTWPHVKFKSGFTQISVLQALMWSDGAKSPAMQGIRYRKDAGRIMENKTLEQDANPMDKRIPHRLDYDGRVWRSSPWEGGAHWPESAPYEKRFGFDEEQAEWAGYVGPDGPVMMSFRKALGVG